MKAWRDCMGKEAIKDKSEQWAKQRAHERASSFSGHFAHWP